jgi:hypothetical protein
MTDRITIRLGTLAEALKRAAAKSGRSLIAEARHQIARGLRVKPPVMRPGNPDIADHARAAAQARWAKQQTEE